MQLRSEWYPRNDAILSFPFRLDEPHSTGCDLPLMAAMRWKRPSNYPFLSVRFESKADSRLSLAQELLNVRFVPEADTRRI